jgi:hypothetical protein
VTKAKICDRREEDIREASLEYDVGNTKMSRTEGIEINGGRERPTSSENISSSFLRFCALAVGANPSLILGCVSVRRIARETMSSEKVWRQ